MKTLLNKVFKIFTKNKKKLILVLLVVPVLIGTTLFLNKPKANNNDESDEIKRTIVLEKGELYSSVNIKGVIQSNEVSSVSTNLTSKVIEVNVKVGDQVKKGDIIAKLDSADIQREITDKNKEILTEKSSLQDAYDKLVKQKNLAISNKSNVENDKNNIINKAKSFLDEKNKELNNYKATFDNETNKKNSVENNIKSAINSVTNAEQESQQKYSALQEKINAKTQLENNPPAINEGESQSDYEKRKSDLITASSGAVTKAQEEYDSSYKNLKDKESELSTVKELYNYDQVLLAFNQAQEKINQLTNEKNEAEATYNQSIQDKNTTLKELDSNISSMDESINEAYKKIKEFNSSTLLKELNEKLSNTILKAESDGKITELKVNVGSVPNGTVATIQSTSKLMISAKVQDYDISKISVNQKVKVTTDASSEVFEGILSRISPTASSEGDFEVDITLPESDKLYIGTKARAEIVLFSKKDVIKVPVDAILEKDDGSYVLVKQNDNNFKELKVTKKDTTDIYVEITGNEVVEGIEILANADWDSLKQDTENTIKNSGGY